MNFFKLYIGDYQRDTGTLTLAEHGAYMLMLQHLYATEQPLPKGRDLHRLLRADSKAERDAIDSIASRFFVEHDGGLVNDRAMEEIDKGAHQRAVNREIGKRGGRPLKTECKTECKTERKTDSVSDWVSEREPINNPNQTPDTRLKDTDPIGSGASPDVDTPRKTEPIPYQRIVDAFNATMTKLPKVRDLTGKRRTAIRRAWQESAERRTTEFWEAYWITCEDDPFENGTGPYANGHENWRPSFDYLIRSGTITKIVEKAMHQAKAA